MKFHVVDRAGALKGQSSYALLVRDRWDDYGFKTTFRLFVSGKTATAGKLVEIGDVKILQAGQTEGFTPLPATFDGLGTAYCSLGQSFSYYETLSKLPKRFYRSVLNGLRDIVINPTVALGFEDEPGFSTSLLRSGSAARASSDASALFQDEVDDAESLSSAFRFETSVGGSVFAIDFAFNESRHLPDRSSVIIGYNGTGKTRLLANLAMVANADLRRRADSSFAEQYGRFVHPLNVRFGSVISISYSAFDTFAMPEAADLSENSDLAAARASRDGEVFGYVYCGLRRAAPPEQQEVTHGLKSIGEITEDFFRALARTTDQERRKLLIRCLALLAAEPSFGRVGTEPYSSGELAEQQVHFSRLSTGHKIVLNIVVQLVAHIEVQSLVLIDEPESHLHPPLLAALLRSVNVVLRRYDSCAVIATHSPVVLQEVSRRQVRVLERFGKITRVRLPQEETFGENVGYLTSTVFNLDNSATDYHGVLQDIADELDLQAIEALFGGRMSAQARAYVLAIKRTQRGN